MALLVPLHFMQFFPVESDTRTILVVFRGAAYFGLSSWKCLASAPALRAVRRRPRTEYAQREKFLRNRHRRHSAATSIWSEKQIGENRCRPR
jgi:hypothetical protein